ncbi:MAG: LamG-like jellyroll fold domain-containing protein [Patescibacteria group bacterium]
MKSSRSFTVIELLVVLAMVGLLSAVILVSLNNAREKGIEARAKSFHGTVSRSLGAQSVGIWRLEEESGVTAVDDSGNQNNGTLHSGVTRLTSGACSLGFGRCGDFNGLGGHIYDISSNPFEYRGGDMTIAMWVNQDVGETWGYLISKPWNGSGVYNYRINLDPTDTLSFTLRGETEWGTAIPNKLQEGKWTYIVVSLKGTSQEVTIYMNGQLSVSTIHSILGWTSIPGGDGNISLAIGTLYPYGAAWVGLADYEFDGKIDDVSVFERALTTAEVKKLYAAGLPHHQLARE